MSVVSKKSLHKDEAMRLIDEMPIFDTGILITQVLIVESTAQPNVGTATLSVSPNSIDNYKYGITHVNKKCGLSVVCGPHIWLLPEDLVANPECTMGMLLFVGATIGAKQKFRNMERVFFVGLNGDEPNMIMIVSKNYGYIGNRIYGGNLHKLIPCNKLEKKIVDHIIHRDNMAIFKEMKESLESDIKKGMQDESEQDDQADQNAC